MKSILLFLISTTTLFIHTTALAQSPSYTWSLRAGEINYENVSGISTDINGNIAVAGSFYGRTLIFGTDTLVNADTTGYQADIFAAKYDPSGNPLWAKRAGGIKEDKAMSCYSDAGGNIYVTGNFYDTVIVFDTDTLIASGGMNANVFVVKYDPLGNELWAKGSRGPSVATGADVSADAGGNVFISGWYIANPGFSTTFGTTVLATTGAWDLFVVKYDASGNLLWVKSSGGANNERAFGISTDAGGNSYITGYFESPTITFGTITLANSGPSHTADVFITKYDPSGNTVWAKSLGDSLYDKAYRISTDLTGNSVISGFLNGNMGPFDVPYSERGFLSKFDSSGNLLWTKNAAGTGDSFVEDVAFDRNGDVLITGEFFATSIWGSDTLTNVTPGVTDVFIVKYDAAGNHLWSKSAGGAGYDAGHGIATDTAGNILVTGDFYSATIDFGTTTLTNANAGSSDTSDIFIVKLNDTQAPSGIANTENTSGIAIYPNPYSGNTTITYELTKKSQVTIEVYNTVGNKIATPVQMNQAEGAYSYYLYGNENGLVTGLYFIKITIDGKSITKRIIQVEN